ncbi:mitogen-activated protein kinase kinase kinase 3-like [Coffea eugenioides]|uniref:Mitogen-activated protein kinase kinase kinase 20-like n=1 Tax=Coffea arabica TaxID=13443 RepID=A0ABM4WQD0_COFAR|nr:mitogen-activated protein kinase kinase kinase 3-like [Coffea eugenioides]
MAITWKTLKILLAGSYGKVYLTAPVESSTLSALAAVKSADAWHSSALLEGGLYLSELRGHPNIIQCFGHDISTENGEDVYNLLLEYAAGAPFMNHDLINKNKGTIPESLVACYTFITLKGLSAIQEVNIVHRDIKPGNILVYPSGDHENN